MPARINTWVNWLLYSNIFIGLCALSLVRVNTLAFPGLLLPSNYDLAVFLGTIGFYALHRSLRHMGKPERPSASFREHFLDRHKQRLFTLGTVLLASGIILSMLSFSHSLILMLVPATIITALYVLPILPGGYRLRDLPFIKIILIALIWSYTTAVIPLVQTHLPVADKLLFSVDRFLFILAITLPFDIRDRQLDEEAYLKTIPVIIGIKPSKWLATAALISGLACLSISYSGHGLSLPYLIASGMTYLVAAFLVWRSSENRVDHYFTGYIDGLMILVYLLTVVLSTILH